MKRYISLLLIVVVLFCATAGAVPAFASGSEGFSPDELAGLLGWYDASSLALEDGAAVGLWPNQAGEGSLDAVQSDAARQPVYTAAGKVGGKPAVRLTKSSFLKLQGDVNLADFSIFAVTNLDAIEGTADSNQIFSKLQLGSPHHHSWYFNIKDGFNFGWHDAAGYHDYTGTDRAVSANTEYILAGTKAGTRGQLYINGKALGSLVSSASDPAASACGDPVYIGGCGANGEAWSVEGDICEILLFDRGLTAAEAGEVNLYLAQKWGVAIDADLALEGEIAIDGEPLRPFSEEIAAYRYTVAKGTTEPPRVTADFNHPAEVTQAATLPGTATVTVGEDGRTKTFTIRFEILDTDVMNLKQPEIEQVEITGGFWKEKLELFRTTTVKHVLDNLEKSGTLQNFDNVANGTSVSTRTCPWNDGLLFESIRAAADFLRVQRDPELEAQIDGYIDRIYAASLKSDTGYLSTAAMQDKPGQYFDATGDARWYHDAYNFGCMAEAAVHYYKATGGSAASLRLLFVVTRFAAFIADNYGYGTKADGTPKINMVPSHEGPEEMLLKLYTLYRDEPALKAKIEGYNSAYPLKIDEEAYASLVRFWIENRGVYDGRVNGANYGTYAQDHAVYYEQTEGTGHAVRANLFYTGLAAAGREFGNLNYIRAAKTLYDNITEKQMYVTGGVGVSGAEEAYGPGYDLPNTGYCETCAQAAMGFFSEYLGLTFGESRYADTVEKYMYNGVLGCAGEDGKSFYYVQPLTAQNAQRWEWIDYTPCCPPMFLKFYSELPAYLYSYTDTDVYVNQFASSRLTLPGLTVTQESEMPFGGVTSIRVEGGDTTLRIRIPDWADAGRVSLTVGEAAIALTLEKGYAVVPVKSGETVTLTLPMEARRVYNDPQVKATEGMVSFAWGPLNYCFEKIDNPYIANWNSGEFCFGVRPEAEITAAYNPALLGGVVTLSMTGDYYNTSGRLSSATVTAIPFYARSNRGSMTSYVFVGEAPDNTAGNFKRWLAGATSTRTVGESAAAAFDGELDTAWVAGAADFPQALAVDLGEEAAVGTIRVTFPSQQAWKYQVLGSSDGKAWILLADKSENAESRAIFTETVEGNVRYVALLLTDSAGVGYASVREVEVCEAGSSVNLAKGKLCAASSVNEVGDSAFAMIDGNKNTRYCPPGEEKPQTVTFDLGAKTSFEGISILFEKPSDWTYTVELSDDGVQWNEYISETFRMTADGETHTVSRAAAARYLRFTVTATTGGVWASVWEFDLLSASGSEDIFTSIFATLPESDPVMPGDVDGDGSVTVSDVVALRQAIVSGENTGWELTAGDLDENGALTVTDVVELRARIVKG